jgi:CRP/FNR family cyclic AMP-dependent transcriptional regulator
MAHRLGLMTPISPANRTLKLCFSIELRLAKEVQPCNLEAVRRKTMCFVGEIFPAAMAREPIRFHCEVKTAAASPLLSKTLPPAASRELDEIKRLKYYPSRSVLLRQGERPPGVLIVRRGTVKISITSSNGRTVILRVAGVGEILGLSSVLSGEPCLAAAETLEETEVAYIDSKQFLQVLLQNPEAALSIALHACSNYEIACEQISLLALCRSASERVAHLILSWTRPRAHHGAPPVWLGLTHEEISQVAGTSRETVTRTLLDFRKKGWASLASSKLIVQDREAIERLVA